CRGDPLDGDSDPSIRAIQRCSAGDPEPSPAVLLLSRCQEPIRTAQLFGFAVPVAATDNTFFFQLLRGADRIRGVRLPQTEFAGSLNAELSGVPFGPQRRTPLRDVAVHVEQPESIWRLLADPEGRARSGSGAVPPEPGMLVQIRGVITEGVP